jgi:hypothetical protein
LKSAALRALAWRALASFAFCGFALCLAAAQNFSDERTFPESKGAVEKGLKTIQSSTTGRLPLLEGFTVAGDRPLDRFQRGYYSCTVQVSSVASGGSKVRVNAKITAWYSDPLPSRSGYKVLPSNGRLESDLLDRLADALNREGSTASASSPAASGSNAQAALAEPAISAPMPRIPDVTLRGSPINKSAGNPAPSLKAQTDSAEKHEQDLAAEAKGLEEILQNQAHPTNLAAVRKTGTPVLQSPNVDAKILFSATAGDEFEILDVNSSWVHVRISGLSRGWIRRSALEMPEDFAAEKQLPSKSSRNNEQEFRLSKEQVAPFPGDWEPLRGKIVKILTVQNAGDSAKSSPARAKLQFAKVLLLKQYAELAAADGSPAGIVLIFDSDDGGMLAATLGTLREWQGGSMPDETAWRQCFFDPPELFADSP